MNRSKQLVALLVLIVACIIITVINHAHHRTVTDYGNVTIDLQLPSSSGVSATINGEKLQITSLSATHKLKAGSDTLRVQKAGYKPFSANFEVARNESLIITVALKSNAPQSTAVANQQVQASFANFIPQGFSLVSAQYFYDNTWVVATISSDGGDTAIIVAQYVGGSSKWETELGPGTIYFPSDTVNLPPDVVNYMAAQHYILEGDDD